MEVLNLCCILGTSFQVNLTGHVHRENVKGKRQCLFGICQTECSDRLIGLTAEVSVGQSSSRSAGAASFIETILTFLEKDTKLNPKGQKTLVIDEERGSYSMNSPFLRMDWERRRLENSGELFLDGITTLFQSLAFLLSVALCSVRGIKTVFARFSILQQFQFP